MAAIVPLPASAPVLVSVDPKATSMTYSPPPTPPLSDDEREAQAGGKSKLGDATDRPKAAPAPSPVFERRMGDTELSYYLPSRADGVNDMYLHLGFRAPAALLAPARVRAAWAYFRLLHPPLAAQVHARAGEYADVRFAYTPPRSVAEALVQAGAALELQEGAGKDALIDSYLNGPRTLSDEKLAYLVLSCAPSSRVAPLPTPASTPLPASFNEPFAIPSLPPAEETDDIRDYDLLICATHFLGDGMALHRFANELFTLLAVRVEGGKEKSTEDIEEMLSKEWERRWGEKATAESLADVLPSALEDSLPTITGRFKQAAGKIDFQKSQDKCIGGHAFPRKKHPVRHTVVPTVPFDAKKTKAILKKCKENGVSIANALFALSGIAWSRYKERDADQRKELPLMMYSALNLRPYLLPSASAPDSSYWFTAVGYFNVILPSFLPSSDAPAPSESESEQTEKTCSPVHQAFWHRARTAKKQSTLAAKHPLLVSRTREMALLRGVRARAWAQEDDEKAQGTWVAPPPKAPAPAPASDPEADAAPWKLPPAPSAALVGLSLLGNLDGMYRHADYPALVLHTLTTGSRQRAGAMLLFGYTFAGRLWLSLGYDANGFADGAVEGWWTEFLRGVDEFLVG